MTKNQQSLIGYAVLRANHDANAPSFLDNFRGFVLDAITESEQNPTDSGVISGTIATRFGISIPTLVVKRIAKRAVASGFIEGNEKAGYRLTKTGARDAPRISEQVVRFRREQEELVSKFRSFLTNTSAEHAKASNADLAEQLSAYFQEHSIALLSQAIRGENSTGTHTNPGFDYLISTFVAHLSQTDQVAFGYIESAAKGAILASTVSVDTSSLQQNLNRLTIVLDTPAIIDLMGWHGQAAELATTQLVGIAKTLGAQVAVFEHSVRELDGVLETAENSLRPIKGTRRYVTRIESHFVECGYRPADVVLLRARLEDELQAREVNIIEKPQDYMAYGLDEVNLGERLDQAIGYRSVSTRNYDVDSLAAIHRMRKGSTSMQIERLSAIMVTTNSVLAHVSREFARDYHSWPLAMTDFALAAALWVRRPDAADSLPRQQLIATAYAGMQPAPHLWGVYLDEIDRLVASGEVSDQDALLFRAGNEPRRALMEVTLGEEDDLDSQSLQDVLDQIRSTYRRPGEERASKAEANASAASTATDSITTDWLESEQKLSSLKTEVETLRAEHKSLTERDTLRAASDKSRRDQIIQNSARTVRILTIATLVVIAVILAGLGVVGLLYPGILPASLQFLRVLLIAGGAIVTFATILQLFISGSVLNWIQPIEKAFARVLTKKRLAAANLEPLDRAPQVDPQTPRP